ncbi:MAG: HEAT repeat domain-containing protein [Planctomycetota bacterium]
MRTLFVLPFAAILFVGRIGESTSLANDLLDLRGPGGIVGAVEEREKYAVVVLDDGLQMAIPRSSVARVVEGEEFDQYRKLKAQAGDDAERHFRLARWCMSEDGPPAKKEQFRRYHLERAVELDPQHAEARVALGYTRSKNQWVRTSELMHGRGLVMHRGRWSIPEVAASEEQARQRDIEAKKFRRRFARDMKTYLSARSDPRQIERIWDELVKLDDPIATMAVVEQMKEIQGIKTPQVRKLRRQLIMTLGKFRTIEAVQTLVALAIGEGDAQMRELAVEQLRDYGSSSLEQTALQILSTNSSSQLINQAARALSEFPREELAMRYAESLVTTHKQVTPPGPGMNVGIGNNGAAGMNMGSKATVVVEKKTNPQVLALLRKVVPEVDFGYDEDKWLDYLAEKRARYSGDLRHDQPLDFAR